MPKKMYVIQADDGMFYCGMRYWDKQLRKAKIYHSLVFAEDITKAYEECNCKIVEVSLTIVPESKTNADRIRAMSDEELARFAAEKIVNLENQKMIEQGHTPTATQLSALGQTMYCILRRWLREPAEGE